MGAKYATIPGLSAYRVGDDGSVWSLWKRTYPKGGRRGVVYVIGVEWVQLRHSLVSGYPQVSLTDDEGKVRQAKVHHLVLEAFIGPRPPGLQGLHKDDVSTNNNLRNLYWGTQLKNMADACNNGLIKRGQNHPGTVLTDSKVRRLMTLAAAGTSTSVIARELGVSRRVVSNVIHGWVWNHITGLPRRKKNDRTRKHQTGP